MIILLLILVITGFVLGINSTYQSFHPSSIHITFNVTGMSNSTNLSNSVSIHFECIKYCVKHLSGYSEKESCYNQCEKLGGCSN